MIYEVRMPRLDEDMKEGTIIRWKKNPGDRVEKDEPLVEIETQKVNYEIQAPGGGVLRLILKKEDELVAINTIIAVIAEPNDDVSSYLEPEPTAAKHAVTEASGAAVQAPLKPPTASAEAGERILISPIARKLAGERGIDISTLHGTGPGGRITKEDVLRFTPPRDEAPQAKSGRRIREVFPFSGMRKAIADRMTASWQGSPRAENIMSVDVSQLMIMREKYGDQWEERRGVRPSVTDALIAAVAGALREFPMVNSSLKGDRIEVYEDINISVAVALEKGLITPVVRRADTLSVFEIAAETRRLIELVRSGKHSAETIADSTFTITNLGMYDVEVFIPIINPPEAAILAVGKIEKKPVIIQDAIAIRSMMTLCLAYDHRVVDGALAARFLQRIKRALIEPVSLFPEESAGVS